MVLNSYLTRLLSRPRVSSGVSPSCSAERRFELLQEIRLALPASGHEIECLRMAVALAELGSVSTHECRTMLGIYAPAARKFELVRVGMPIKTRWVAERDAAFCTRRVGLYCLASTGSRSAAGMRQVELDL